MMTGTAVWQVGEDGRPRHNWVERNAFEVYGVISRKGGKVNVFVRASAVPAPHVRDGRRPKTEVAALERHVRSAPQQRTSLNRVGKSVRCQLRTLFKNDVCDASREHLSLQT
jgi:hypothetical protein